MASSIDWFYVLYKQDEGDQNWKVLKTAKLNVDIGGLLSSTQYIAKVIGNSSATGYWSSPVKFRTSHCKFDITTMYILKHSVGLWYYHNKLKCKNVLFDLLLPFHAITKQKCLDQFVFLGNMSITHDES